MKKILLGILAIFVLSFSFASASKKEADFCTYEYAPVCGVDGITYGNKCMAGKVKIAHTGECKKSEEKVKACTLEYAPVCGIDGKTYGNKCAAGKVKIAHTGECKKSEEKVEACTLEYAPVCGVDGKTYGNKCAAGKVKIAYTGECKVDNMSGACPAIYMPVIGTDGKTYSNECMAKAAGAFDNNVKMNNEKLLNSYLDFNLSLPMPMKDEKEFLKKYGKVCVSATDGVNTHFIKNGEIVGSTRVGIPANFKPVYTCLAFEGLVLDQDLKSNFENSLKKLSLQEIKKINSALKNFYKDTKDFDGNLAKTQKLVKKIDEIKKVIKSEKDVAVLDYIKYQVTELFSQK